MAERRSEAGFLLLEVLVALAVAGILLVVLVRAFGTIWSGGATVREEAEAMMVANYVLETAVPRSNPSPGVKQGVSGRYSWAMTIAPISLENVASSPVSIAQRLLPAGMRLDIPSGPTQQWMLFRVNIVVNAPNGRRTVIETFRLSRPS